MRDRSKLSWVLRSGSAVTALAFSLSFTISPATAQEEQEEDDTFGGFMLEEVVVTAQKREQSLQDVGIAIQAFTGDQLLEFGVKDSFDLAAFTPGVHISGNLAGQNTQFTIRGVTQNDFNDIVEAPNAAYLDEGYLAIAQAQTFATFDVSRVEILKGPQGTLFGRNATGGLVHFISNKPSFTETEGYLDFTYGLFEAPNNANAFRTQGAFSTPLTDNLAARFAFAYNRQEPFLQNNFPAGFVGTDFPGEGAGADLGNDDTFSGRAIFMYQPTDRFLATLSVNGSRSRLNTGPYQQIPTIGVVNEDFELINVIDVAPDVTRATIGPGGIDIGSDVDNDGFFAIGGIGDPTGSPPGFNPDFIGRPVPGGDFFGFIDPDGFDFSTSSDFAFEDQGSTDTIGVNLKLEYDLTDNIVLTSISDFKNYNKLLFIDVDAGPGNQSANYAGVDAESASQEIRLNGDHEKFRWVGGFFYLHIDADSDNGLKFPNGSVALAPGQGPFDLGSDAQLVTNSYSIFGQGEYDLTSKVTLIGGVRIIQEEKDYNFAQNIYAAPDPFQVHLGDSFNIGPVFGPKGPEPFEDTLSQTLVSAKAQIEYRPFDDLLTYVGYNRGVKAGSFNAQLAGGLPIPTEAIPYDEEVLTSVEGGFKWTFAQGRARLNANAFYYDYQGYQAFLFTGVSGVVVNNDATNVGVEVEFIASPIDGLDIVGGLAWFDATVEDVPLRVDGPISIDADPTYAPELQVNGLIRYQREIFGGLGSIQGDIAYSDSYFYNLRNFDADQFNSYILANAGVRWETLDGHWSVGFRVENIGDERVGVQGFDLATLCGCNEVSFRPPRFYRFNIRYEL